MSIIGSIMNKLGVHLQYRLRITKFNYERAANLHPDVKEVDHEHTI